MDIVIIGDGKVGHKLATQLSGENYNVTLIDQCEKKLADTVNEMDVSCVPGDGGNAEVQKRAGVPGADLVINSIRELPEAVEKLNQAAKGECGNEQLL